MSCLSANGNEMAWPTFAFARYFQLFQRCTRHTCTWRTFPIQSRLRLPIFEWPSPFVRTIILQRQSNPLQQIRNSVQVAVGNSTEDFTLDSIGMEQWWSNNEDQWLKRQWHSSIKSETATLWLNICKFGNLAPNFFNEMSIVLRLLPHLYWSYGCR